ncbi:uncharacterized protein THITE_110056 [Thermothielavioides terrestris NRRL 8126]|uniref:Uncharacterized protein n=1 Tax=Thermothielavioides terrestris (strain ATCC 38088 / NRRL 8126) TaxID=578455 RepID=G2QZB0_THETT|nr:uncharacterized protein THITE_110056 [Thermothielavioides terrestris NRRL 8126]AEO67143.1 hypothetical protein THITE_110056 [Thermothielavioides terrestris NRRL 8126]
MKHAIAIAAILGVTSAAVIPGASRQLNQRDLEQLDPRFNLGSILKGAAKIIPDVIEDGVQILTNQKRDEEELAERDLEQLDPRFNLGSILKGAAKIIPDVIEDGVQILTNQKRDLTERDLDQLGARSTGEGARSAWPTRPRSVEDEVEDEE